jgi:hypothetical protein
VNNALKIVSGMAATTVLAGGMALGMVAAGGSTPQAQAAGAVTETVSQVNKMVNAKCYDEVRTETRYYSHSSARGWVRLVKPAKTVATSRHCLK